MLKRNSTIDIIKIIMCFFVICEHTHPFLYFSEKADFWSIYAVFKIAVPFFLMCSGYFLGLQYRNKTIPEIKKYIFEQIKKITLLYISWSVIYFLFDIFVENKNIEQYFIYYLNLFLFKGTEYHFWYLSAIIYAYIFLWFLIPIINDKKRIIICICTLYTVYFLYAYKTLLFQNDLPLLQYIEIFETPFTGVFRCVPFLLLGVLLSYKTRHNKKTTILLFFITEILLILEIVFSKHFGNNQYSYLIMTLPNAFFLFDLLIDIKIDIKKTFMFSELSTFCYCFHLIVKWYIIPQLMQNYILCCLLTFIISLIVFVIYKKIKSFTITIYKIISKN